MSLPKLGRYELLRVLGKGAMGLVYEAIDPNLERRVAIKTIKVDSLSHGEAIEYEGRFRIEARSAARLQHPNIVSVYDSDRDGDVAYLVMEFVQGQDLKHHLDHGTQYSLTQTLSIMADLLSALDYAHEQNIVHRDIKPANLLIEASGRIKLADFGVARMQDSAESTRTMGSMVGTLKYMAPEQIKGMRVDSRADLFSAGIVLHQLLTGKRPFDGESDFEVIQQIIRNHPAAPSYFNSQLPVALDAVVAKALAKSRDDRYATAREFAEALKHAGEQAGDPELRPPMGAPTSGSTSTWSATVRSGESLLATGLQTRPDAPAGMAAESKAVQLSATFSGLTPTLNGGATVGQELELVYWKDVKDSAEAEDIQVFLDKFPSGVYADLARRRLRKLTGSGSDQTDTRVLTPTFAQALAEPGPHAPDVEPMPASVPPGPSVKPARPAKPPPERPRDGTPDASRPGARPARATPPSGADMPSARPGIEMATPVMQADSVKDARSASGGRATPARESASARASVKTAARASRKPKKSPVPLMASVVIALLVVGAAVSFALFSGSSDAGSGQSEVPVQSSTVGAAAEPASASSAPSSPSSPPVVAAPASETATRGDAASVASVPAPAPAPAAILTSVPELSTTATNTAPKPAPRPTTGATRAAAVVATKASAAAPAERPAAGPAPDSAPVASQASVPAQTPAPPARAPSSPRQACEDRILIGFQMCMAEQCAKPAFTQHPLCVERRLFEQRRREAEDARR